MKKNSLVAALAVFLGLTTIAPTVCAQTSNVVSDNFTGTTTNNPWISFGNACLTAGNGTGTSNGTTNDIIPACTTITDTAPNGALRLTDAKNNEAGAIIIDPVKRFSSQDGIQVTFTTYTYGGDSGGAAKDGADGIGFYLLDANYAPNIGSWGGSLGYSCSNTNNPYNGMSGAYIGLGMDEYGNFLNAGDNTGSGVDAGISYGAADSNGNKGATGSGGTEYQPGRIGLRGYGNINLATLQNAVDAAGVSYTVTSTDVLNTCKNGGNFTVQKTIYNFSSHKNGATYTGKLYSKKQNGSYVSYTGSGTAYGLDSGNYYALTSSQKTLLSKQFPDYAVIPGGNVILPSGSPIALESATTRSSARPMAYKLQITNDGKLSLWYSYNGGNYTNVLNSQSISSSNGTMPTNFLFGFGASTGGSTNVHEITCFQATPATLSASSAGVNVQQTGEVQTGTQVYLAYYHTNNWWGQLESQNINVDASGTVSISTVANWDASCVLTGGSCAGTGKTTAAQGPSDRRLITWSGGPNNPNSNPTGIPFTYGRLTSIEEGWLNDDGHGSDRVDYLSGNRNNEVPSSNATANQIFRVRSSVLGDIINASPVWVGPPSSPYPDTWKDNLYPTASNPENATGAQTYGSFTANEATRINVVYQGANDGFMHAFETGFYKADGTYAGTTDANGNFVGTYNDGKELFAYMPEAVLATIHNSSTPALDYSSPNYSHNYFVDSTPGTGDLFYGGQWHTWLVSGLGAGGNAIFALDITDLGNTSYSSTPGVNNVIGEWSTAVVTDTSTTPATTTAASTLVCTNNANCGQSLGQTYGTPTIRRLHNGEWGIIFGNGLNSVTGDAGIYIMTITSTGSIDKTYYLSTGEGTSGNPNGISYATPVDLDGDHITDYVYAGDAYGNVWRFDLTSNIASNWTVSTYGGQSPTPLFTTPTTNWSVTKGGITSSGTTNQPITTQVQVLAVTAEATGQPRVMVEFGTGAITPQNLTSAAQYAGGQQALYGIWDWDMGVTGTAGATYAGLTHDNAPTSAITIANLTQQTITSTTTTTQAGSVQGFRTVSSNQVCFVGSNCGSTSGSSYGWYLNLSGFAGVSGVGDANQTEQVIYNPIESEGAFIVNTTVPANNSPLTCSVSSAQGWTMALNPATGGAFETSFFGTANGSQLSSTSVVSGIAISATGSPSIVSVNNKPYMINQTVSSVPTINSIFPPSGKGSRLTWLELH